jgi:hypothetical protein
MHETPSMSAKGLIRSLYDFKFTSLIAQRVIRFLYALAVVLYTLFAVLFFIALITKGKAAGAAFGIIVLPIFYFFSLISLRVGYEVVIVFFQIGEDVRVMRIGKGGGSPAPAVATPMATPMVAPSSGTPTAPPGWHLDVTDPTRERYWDGSKWTDQFRPRSS